MFILAASPIWPLFVLIGIAFVISVFIMRKTGEPLPWDEDE